MLAKVHSATLLGITGQKVSVEVHVSSGLPSFNVVGLPDKSCRESRDRVRAAFISSGFSWPAKRITVNLAPSGVPKFGSGLDLAMAIAILAADEQIPLEDLSSWAFIGELGLDGSLKKTTGTLSLIDAIYEDADVSRQTVVAPDAHEEASLVKKARIATARNLADLVSCIKGEDDFLKMEIRKQSEPEPCLEILDVRGQKVPKIAMEISAAGGHHLLMVGPPGSGKSMLAGRMPGLLEGLSPEAAMEVTRIHSAAGMSNGGLHEKPPFRAPHHTISLAALAGGGSSWIRPGEISAAHRGILFLDEMGEFPAVVLDTLRQPLEEGVIRISRAVGTSVLPARFLLIGAMNPCPCGLTGTIQSCVCSEAAKAKYLRRISGPLLDRFDLRIRVSRPLASELMSTEKPESMEPMKERIMAAREIARDRGVPCNAELSPEALREYSPLENEASEMLEAALNSGRISARGANRIRCVALTISDLKGDKPSSLKASIVASAMMLRQEPFDFRQPNISFRDYMGVDGAEGNTDTEEGIYEPA